MVAGGVHGCMGVCVVAGGMAVGGGACVGYDEIRSMSGRYVSYWNAFLFFIVIAITIHPIEKNHNRKRVINRRCEWTLKDHLH